MLQAESKFIGFLKKHSLVLLAVAVVLGTLAIKFLLRGHMSNDLKEFLVPWVRTLRQEGLVGILTHEKMNYNAAYLLLLWLASLLPVEDIVCIKLVSFVFDYIAAGAMAFAVLQLLPAGAQNRKRMAVGAFVGTLLLPLPFINSAMWGQCDIIYASFLLLCLAFLLKEKYTLAFTMFALAFSFKMQAVFFLPVLLVLYCTSKRFTILQFLQTPVFVFLFGLIGLVGGAQCPVGFPGVRKPSLLLPRNVQRLSQHLLHHGQRRL